MARGKIGTREASPCLQGNVEVLPAQHQGSDFPQLPEGTLGVTQWPSSEVVLRREGSSLRIHFPHSKAPSPTDFCFSGISMLNPF